jgi:RNA exonuclease 4
MGQPFFTKKQKAAMRERRKKKKLPGHTEINGSKDSDGHNENEGEPNDIDAPENDSTSKKRPREEEEDGPSVANHEGNASLDGDLTTKMMHGKLYVLMPSDLSTKDAKKFRKDARRKLREQGSSNEMSIEIGFVTKEDMPSLAHPSKKKKRSKEFPSIKELLKQKQQMEMIQKEESKLQGKLNMIPEDVRAQYVAMDCEMVGIGTDGKKSALARVSLVDWNHDVVLDTFVKVPIRVTDFRTHVSGVEPKHIKNQNAMEVQKCRDLVAKLLKDKILVGHALTNDFKALMLAHPKDKIRDTAKYRPFQRYANGKWRPRKLRDLVKENLKGKDTFQEAEHDSVQDAKATMELFQLVFSAWEKDIASKSK